MKFILTLIGILITAIIYGQLPAKIDMFYPDEYFGPIEKTDLDSMTIYFGVYESNDKEYDLHNDAGFNEWRKKTGWI